MSTQISDFTVKFSFYSGCIIFATGVIGNIFNVLTFTQLKLFRENRYAFYLVIESISSFLFESNNFTQMVLIFIYGDDATARSLVWCRFKALASQGFALTTYCMICFVAVDQFFSTSYLYNLRQMCTSKLARCLTTVTISVIFAYSILNCFFFNIESYLGCVILNPIWLQFSTSFFYPVVAGLLPIVIASLFGMLSYRNVRRIVRRQLPVVRRRLDRQMTAMILARVILFVSLALPYAIYRIYILKFPIPRSQSMQYAVMRLVQTIFLTFTSLDFTASFYVFLLTSARFRRQVRLVLVKKCWQRCKVWCCSKPNEITPENLESRTDEDA